MSSGSPPSCACGSDGVEPCERGSLDVKDGSDHPGRGYIGPEQSLKIVERGGHVIRGAVGGGPRP